MRVQFEICVVWAPAQWVACLRGSCRRPSVPVFNEEQPACYSVAHNACLLACLFHTEAGYGEVPWTFCVVGKQKLWSSLIQ